MIDARGRGLLGEGRFGPAYWQDHLPVREATDVAGHAVRQLYLDCGAVDVAVETGDAGLLDAVVARWRDMVATRTYLTGGLGSRARDEAFGDPYELPPDLAYAETCASIASVMLAWRLLLATGDPACADVIERTIYNGVLPGLARTGRRSSTPTCSSAGPTGPRHDRARATGCPGGLRLLPAERHAHAQLVAAVPRDDRRDGPPGPPVRGGDDRRDLGAERHPRPHRHRAIRGTVPSASRSSRRRLCRGRCPCGSPPGRRLATFGDAAGEIGRLAIRRRGRPRDARPGGPARRSCSGWTCRSA